MLRESIPEFADLQIRISPSRRSEFRSWSERLALTIQRTLASSRENEKYVAEVRLPNDEPRLAVLPELPVFSQDSPEKYGVELFKWLLPDGELRQGFREVRWSAESYLGLSPHACGVRLRLWLDPDASELRSVRWEALRDPDRNEPLSQTMAFSRFTFVTSPPGLTASRGRQLPLRLLLVTASPDGLDDFALPAVDVGLESRNVKALLERYGHLLRTVQLEPTASLAEIRDVDLGEFDVVHVSAYGVAEGDDLWLLLPGADGRARKVGSVEMVEALVGSRRPPYLAVLTTPMSGEGNEGAAFPELAALLIRAGVQAVVAVPAPMRAKRLRLFIERFYGHLLQTGTVDQAVADARVAVYRRGEWDWALPLLHLRTFDPQIFPGISGPG